VPTATFLCTQESTIRQKKKKHLLFGEEQENEMKIGVPPVAGEFKTPEAGLHEVIVTEVEAVPKPEQYWKDPSRPEGQFQWTLTIRDGEDKGTTLRLWTGDIIGRSPKNKLVKFLRALDPQFDINTAYADYDEFKSRTVGKPVRVIVELQSKPDRDDPSITRTFGKVTDSFLKTAKPELDVTEQLAALGATQIGDTEHDF
jgi:hypothetical protein